jgi:hypothetical protein
MSIAKKHFWLSEVWVAPPTVVTSSATNITATSATLNGKTFSFTATIRGFDWGKQSGNYTDSWTEEGSFPPASFSHTISDLDQDTTYYFRAKAYSSETGWIYGDELSFHTLAPAGWLTGWSYRKSHVINPASGAGTNYQVMIIAHYGSGTDGGADVYLNQHCRTDFGDVRFTKSDGTTLLDYWMESKVDGDYAVFWVEVADDLSTNPATIYIYYGKSDATTTSNGDNTFIFFDHFPGTALDLNKWVVRQGDVSVANSELILSGTSGTRGLIDGLVSFSINKALHVRARANSTVNNQGHFCSMRKSGDWNYRAGDMFGYNVTNQIQYETWDAGSYTKTTAITVSTFDSYHVYKITWKAGESKGYQDDVLKVTHTTNVPTVDMVVVFYEAFTADHDLYIDWVFVRKWVDPEPSHGSWGSEETVAVVETIVAKNFPMDYLPSPVKAAQLTSKVSGATITKVSQEYPSTALKKDKAAQLKSKWT